MIPVNFEGRSSVGQVLSFLIPYTALEFQIPDLPGDRTPFGSNVSFSNPVSLPNANPLKSSLAATSSMCLTCVLYGRHPLFTPSRRSPPYSACAASSPHA